LLSTWKSGSSSAANRVSPAPNTTHPSSHTPFSRSFTIRPFVAYGSGIHDTWTHSPFGSASPAGTAVEHLAGHFDAPFSWSEPMK
jgi:hypothetical protein